MLQKSGIMLRFVKSAFTSPALTIDIAVAHSASRNKLTELEPMVASNCESQTMYQSVKY